VKFKPNEIGLEKVSRVCVPLRPSAADNYEEPIVTHYTQLFSHLFRIAIDDDDKYLQYQCHRHDQADDQNETPYCRKKPQISICH